MDAEEHLTNEKAAPNRYRCAVPDNGGSEYNNLTDDQLSDAVYKKFYSNMPTIRAHGAPFLGHTTC